MAAFGRRLLTQVFGVAGQNDGVWLCNSESLCDGLEPRLLGVYVSPDTVGQTPSPSTVSARVTLSPSAVSIAIFWKRARMNLNTDMAEECITTLTLLDWILHNFAGIEWCCNGIYFYFSKWIWSEKTFRPIFPIKMLCYTKTLFCEINWCSWVYWSIFHCNSVFSMLWIHTCYESSQTKFMWIECGLFKTWVKKL